jgi:hypothetical protein
MHGASFWGLARGRPAAFHGSFLPPHLTADGVERLRHSFRDYLHVLVGRGGRAHMPEKTLNVLDRT